jgi:hypothetical protein
MITLWDRHTDRAGLFLCYYARALNDATTHCRLLYILALLCMAALSAVRMAVVLPPPTCGLRCAEGLLSNAAGGDCGARCGCWDRAVC